MGTVTATWAVSIWTMLPGCTHLSHLSAHSSGWSNGFIDYNNDGWKDLYSSNGDIDNMGQISRQPDTMFENVDGKQFRDVSVELGAGLQPCRFPARLGLRGPE